MNNIQKLIHSQLKSLPPLINEGKLLFKNKSWHRAIVPVGYPTSIFAATAFHRRVRDGIAVGPRC